MKTFGSTTLKPVAREEFTLNYIVDEEPQAQVFGLTPRMSGGDIAAIAHAAKHDPESQATMLIDLIGKLVDNRDGDVKAKWEYQPIKQKAGDDRPPVFRGPDGELYPVAESGEWLPLWADPANWTSRRRWLHLMKEDDEAIVQTDDLVGIAEWAIGLASGRPTQPQS